MAETGAADHGVKASGLEHVTEGGGVQAVARFRAGERGTAVEGLGRGLVVDVELTTEPGQDVVDGLATALVLPVLAGGHAMAIGPLWPADDELDSFMAEDDADGG